MEKSSWKQFVPALIVWAGAVAIGMAILWNYASTPGSPATPTEQWPTDTQIQRVSGKATLIMLAHPQCPCTRASLRELALIMTRCRGLLTAQVLFFKPKNFARDWEKTDLWQQASIISGVEVGCDIDGIEARRFH